MFKQIYLNNVNDVLLMSLLTYFDLFLCTCSTPFSNVSIVDFEQVNNEALQQSGGKSLEKHTKP